MARTLRGLFRKSGSSAAFNAAANTAGSVMATANTPAPIRGALHEQGMDLTGNFGPGAPLAPYFGYSQRTRATDFPVGVNISTRSRASWGRVSFDTLKALIDAYDVSRMCINHKIDELRSMPLLYQPADSVDDDVDDAIDAAKAALAYPDRELPYDSWLSKWLENALKYDSAPLYRRRDYNGDVIGLEVVDGRTINPYIDANGRRPIPPAPAYYQTVHGMVADWLTTEDIIYNPFRPQEDSPFGLAPIESIILTANTDIRFQWHFLQFFTEGSVPAGFMELPPDVSSPDQVAEWQDYWDAMVMGDQAKLHQLLAVPNGSRFQESKPGAFNEAFPQYLMMRTCAAFGVVPQDLGLVKDVNRANGETQVDVQFRVNTMPWVRYVEGHLTRYLQHDLGLPVKITLDTGRDKEDRLAEAQAHKLYIEMGAESPDEVRVDILGKAIDRERPTPRFINNTRTGPIPILAIESIAGLTDPDTYGPRKDQKAIAQPFVAPIGVIPHPGTTDDQQSLAATDAAQVAERQQLDAEENPNRAAPPASASAPEINDDEGDEQLAKSADVEMAAFRTFIKGARRRGSWERDFTFATLPAAVASELNRGGRAEVAQVAKAKADATAQAVYEQLSENFPPEAIGWVKDVRWTGPVSVPLENVDFSNQDTWAASSEPERVDKTVRKIRAGKPVKPAILIERPGEDDLMVADGHHRAEAAQRAGVPVRAYVAHPKTAVGPWDEMHSSQRVEKANGTPGLTERSGMISLDLEPGTVPIAPGGVTDHHITIVYLGPDVGDDALAEACARAGAAAAALPGPVSGTVGGIGTFHPSAGSDGTTPAFAQVDVPATYQLRDALADLSASEHTDYHPHVTLKYLADGEEAPEPVPPTPVTFTHLAVHRGDSVTRIPLGPPGSQVTKADASPKAPAPQGADDVRQWPGWSRDQELARIYTDRIRQALTAHFDTGDLARRWMAANGIRKAAGDGVSQAEVDAASAAAQAWLEHQGMRGALAGQLAEVLNDLWTEGYVLGNRSASATLGSLQANVSVTSRIDWGAWTPGDPQAANMVLGFDGLGDGLQRMLAAQGVQIKSIGDGRFDDLAQALALSLENGDSAETLARDLRDILDNGSRARLVAVTEINRAVSAATLDSYRTNGVAGKSWLIASGACAICQDNADAGAIPLDAEFPSGDSEPPGHPSCRCALMPETQVGGGSGD